MPIKLIFSEKQAFFYLREKRLKLLAIEVFRLHLNDFAQSYVQS